MLSHFAATKEDAPSLGHGIDGVENKICEYFPELVGRAADKRDSIKILFNMNACASGVGFRLPLRRCS